MTQSTGVQPESEIKIEDIFEPHVLEKYDSDVVNYVLESRKAGIPAQHEWRIENIRANPARFAPPWSKDVTGFERVSDREIISQDGTKIPIKIYHPDPARFGDGPYGLHLNFHGGGFVLGDLTTESQLCLSMRDGAGVVVIDVNYRHCPEATWGKGIEDAFSALLWARESAAALNVKLDSISIGGISAGAHISIVLQHMARDNGIPLKLCLATVPPSEETMLYKSPTESPFPSFTEYANGPILPWARISFFGEHCFPDDKRDEIRATVPEWWIAPIKAKNWVGLCETFIRTAECDPLRDEGEAFGLKFVQGGTKVAIKRYLGSPHTFAYFDWFKKKHEYDLDTVSALIQAHGEQ
ncbi:alpha/beta-hydrolase [Annulohypoxylon maeteangense]|uniref:alpha/beta-hydrolase n=1 Tax=Annulohypoxylon maeteangense TaxID=1927788 RepID=UPI00200867B9|nr:alpha/beta-hydrolase [Annulohypoxylon maeteangense]KAI0880322.1 alpha/beta-hydrolase [Annulohypoxylon maeteangense]